jgi:hypothetical protein
MVRECYRLGDLRLPFSTFYFLSQGSVSIFRKGCAGMNELLALFLKVSAIFFSSWLVGGCRSTEWNVCISVCGGNSEVVRSGAGFLCE